MHLHSEKFRGISPRAITRTVTPNPADADAHIANPIHLLLQQKVAPCLLNSQHLDELTMKEFQTREQLSEIQL